jgi:hypothetical protein
MTEACIFNYDKKNLNFMSNYIINELKKENFNIRDVYGGQNILIKEKYARFFITVDNLTEIYECENTLRKYYNIQNKEKILKIKIEAVENEIVLNKKYNLLYKFNNTNLQELDLSICSCSNSKCNLCSNTSMKYNLCISCNENYYPIMNDSSNIYSYINCYQNPQGYYLDLNESIYNPCYSSSKSKTTLFE